ncbi:Cof-type HAD-IIB family hydrolase [uncultured Endozoicomonas sp.]|uniref:Cof-type HAD-IIB family hydrolase n=1 Tax=uncultured Endozoicomonas sp. TaxID=432652 RepID=UPI00262A3BD1|nr:Cof-type HAD-IIB family hydrolase [uncultured Endozoicomonas sp.]
MADSSRIKLIAVDMDGTFLCDNKTYNRQRFIQQYQALKEKGIRFVVASGNQYTKLKSYFDDDFNDIAYVADNGGYVHDGQRELYVGEIPNSIMTRAYQFLERLEQVSAVICGRNGAYILNTASAEDLSNANKYYQHHEAINSYGDINDTAIKIALRMPADIHDAVLAQANEQLGDVLVPVTSGHEWMDLIMPGIHKAHGIQLLQEQWGIADHEIAAFGDSGNDMEMLEKAAFSFAMDNANHHVQSVARYKAPGNNHEGVLHVIDYILTDELDNAGFQQEFGKSD